MSWLKKCMCVAALGISTTLVDPPVAGAQPAGEAFCAENQQRLDRTNGEMPFEIDEAVAWLTQQLNMSETEAVRLLDNVGETYWSGMNGRWEIRCHGQ